MPRRGASLLVSMLMIALLSPTTVIAQTTTTEPPPQPVTGRVLDGQKRPLAHQPVVLNENRGIANDAVGLLAFAFSAGLSCVAGIDPCRNSGSARVDTDGDGRFAFDVAAVRKARGRSQGVVLLAGDAQNEGAVSVRFNPSTGGDLGTLQLWDPALRITAGVVEPSDIRLLWTAPPEANSRTKAVGTVTNGPRAVSQRPAEIAGFSTFGLRGDVAVDARALEDLPAALTLTTGFSRRRANQNPRVDWLSPPTRLVGAGAPLSRGAACTMDPAVPMQGCRLTDGDLLTAATPPGVATVDLGKSVSAGVVAVRPRSAYAASVSADGTTWKALAEITRHAAVWDASLFAADGPAWRYVRVGGGAASTTLAPAEVSVWPPKTVAQAGDNPVVGPGHAEPAGHRRHRAWLVVLAIALLAAGCVAAGIAIARR